MPNLAGEDKADAVPAVHLRLDGIWATCAARTRACPRRIHLPNTTPQAVAALPVSVLYDLLSVIDPPTKVEAGVQLWLNADNGLHRDHDLPARIWPDGSMEWYQANELHRVGDKPALMLANGERQWREHGLVHRPVKLGPAMITSTGGEIYYLEDQRLAPREVAWMLAH